MSCPRCGEVCTLRFPECEIAYDLGDTDCVDPVDRYRAHVVPQPHVSIAESLLTFWDRPHSPQAKRFAYHALRFALSRGLDPLDATRGIGWDTAGLT